jgi:hypothetical protein
MANNKKIGKIFDDVVSGKKPGWGAANPNFPNDTYVEPTYSRNSGNGPIDPGFNRPDLMPKKAKARIKKTFYPSK